ncbi:ferric reductase [Pyrenophora tritici-repentis]|nr:ferric reductase [Pyrenophora tritici-repentis]KAI1550293.1 ferric reductase [Pyrenophora tritici-repentis]KAI1565874.1 ferric reductase [Pyrenophora tritici-repentis]KAI1569227.1 ferric reductase [Pyrenophora tritici-repentis]PWO22457.1 copper radical oxidase [Pyrenophora tritici-repentis]
MAAEMLVPRAHIQNFSEASTVEPHWGYSVRLVPCTNDKGSCEYLDIVYHSHDLGMLYTGIIWATIGAILLIWGVGRHFARSQPSGVQLPAVVGEGVPRRRSAFERLQRAIPAYARRYLLPDAARPIFGRVTRTQVLTLLVLTGYLTIFTFVGIVYKKWVTPVKKIPGLYQTRSSLGPWSDRIGVLAYALTPLSVMLSTRESILSLVTGLPYQSFNFLHRWLGYIIFVQSALHTIGWCIIEIRLYQPQPTVAIEWIVQTYMVWGLVAMILLTLLVVLSTPWGIRLTGYEFFRKAHYVLAMVYIGACWGHWEKLKVFLLPGLIVWFIDRDAWAVGQHFYLTFPDSSIWQSHPFTPISRPVFGADTQRHSYIFRARKGETRKIADLSMKRIANIGNHEESHEGLMAAARLSVVMTGPYGERTMRSLASDSNVICIAGGTGIAYVLPVLLDLASQTQTPDRHMSLVWVVRRRSDIDWVAPELAILKRKCRNLRTGIHIYVTRAAEEAGIPPPAVSEKVGASDCAKEIAPATSSAASSSLDASSALSVHGVSKSDLGLNHIQARPNLDAVVADFVAGTVRGGTDVFASGPGGMISDLRRIVANTNKGGEKTATCIIDAMTELLDLCYDMLMKILEEINPEDVAACAQASKGFNEFVTKNTRLHKSLYVKHFDDPRRRKPQDPEPDWARELKRVVEFQKILHSAHNDVKTEAFHSVCTTAIHLIATMSNDDSGVSHNQQLIEHYFQKIPQNHNAFMCRSSLYGRAGGLTHRPADNEEDRQLSAKLHSLLGFTPRKFKWNDLAHHPYARSHVYDLRNYTDKNQWGPFRKDGSMRVDWEMIECLMIVIGYNSHLSSQKDPQLHQAPWFRALDGLIPAETERPGQGQTDYLTLVRQPDIALDMKDPYGVSAIYGRLVCFLDYQDLWHFNFSNEAMRVPPNRPREALTADEAFRHIVMSLWVTDVTAPGPLDHPDLPIVHFEGVSRSVNAQWDPNANSGIRGTVRMTREGEVRWQTISVFQGGEERWRSDGIQVGGMRCPRGVIGTWFDKDFDAHGPAGPTAFWKIAERLSDSDREGSDSDNDV